MDQCKRNFNLIFGLIELIFCGFNILLYFNYKFEPSNDIAFMIFLFLFFGLATYFSIKYKNIQTRTSRVFGGFIPLFTFIFMISLGFIMELSEFYNGILFLISMISSVIIFFNTEKSGAIKDIFRGIFALLYVPALAIPVLMIMLSDFGTKTAKQDVISPNGTYSAWVVDSDQGALGGDTHVYVRNLKKDMPIMGGTLKSKESLVHLGPWGEKISLSWKDEKNLILNGQEYNIP